LWAGQGLRMLRKGPASTIMAQLRQEIIEATSAVCNRLPVSVR
jgi:hypothetical protein